MQTECDNLSEIWKCPFGVNSNICDANEEKIDNSLDSLYTKGILLRSIDNKYKLNRW